MTIKNTLIAAALATSLLAVPAHAGTTRISTEVEFADLDLTTDEGAEALSQRLRDAVREMCGNYDRRDNMGPRPFRECVNSVEIEPIVATLVADAREAAGEAPVELAAK